MHVGMSVSPLPVIVTDAAVATVGESGRGSDTDAAGHWDDPAKND